MEGGLEAKINEGGKLVLHLILLCLALHRHFNIKTVAFRTFADPVTRRGRGCGTKML